MNTKRIRRAVPLTSYAEAVLEEVEAVESSGEDTLAQYWQGVLAFENELTGDGRMIEGGALEWETPAPLRYVSKDSGAHDGAVVVGRILEITRDEATGGLRAQGDFDLGSEVGREASRLVRDEFLTGVSLDLDAVAFEVRIAREVAEAHGLILSDNPDEAMSEEGPPLETAEDGSIVVFKGSPDDEVMVMTAARVRAATLVAIPAFKNARIEVSEGPAQSNSEGLAASAAPVEPPREWFDDPGLEGPTALQIGDDGRVYGHLATWDTCHLADPSGAGICVKAPKSKTGYAYFHTGAVKCADGSQVATGTIRFNTKHAGVRANAATASAHYDNTGLAGADVRAGEDQYGIWVAGALRPSVTPEEVRILRASPLSGDWRQVRGNLELVGALSVNLAGFPIPRPAGLVASGEEFALVAAGSIAPARSLSLSTLDLSESDEKYLRKMIDRERLADTRALARRVRQAKLRQSVSRVTLARNTAELAGHLEVHRGV